MKHLLSGTAFAAALVIAAPVWAQTSAIPRPPAAPTAASAPHDTMGSHARIHRVKARHRHATRRGSARGSDNMANQLNAQEAARNAGAGAPPPAYGRPTNVYGQPNQVYGIPGAGQPSPSPDYSTAPRPAR
jgi:hypothetical protein